MHARPVREGLALLGTCLLGSNTLAFAKAPRSDPTATNYARLTLSQLRTIADEIETFGPYGRDVFLWTYALLGGGKNQAY
jgi:hypothetical protein